MVKLKKSGILGKHSQEKQEGLTTITVVDSKLPILSKSRKHAFIFAGLMIIAVAVTIVVLVQMDKPDVTNDKRSDAELASSVNARESESSLYFSKKDPQGLIETYNRLIANESDDNEKAALYSERATFLSSNYLAQYKDLILADAVEADRLKPTAASARLVEMIAEDTGNTELVDKYAKLYLERAEPNAQTE